MLLVCAFLLLAPAARAGFYAVTYSCAQDAGIAVAGPAAPYALLQDQTSYDYGEHFTQVVPGLTATASGNITATFTWNGTGPTDLPPSAVIVMQSCSVTGTGRDAANGLGSPTAWAVQRPGQSNGLGSPTAWAVQRPGQSKHQQWHSLHGDGVY